MSVLWTEAFTWQAAFCVRFENFKPRENLSVFVALQSLFSFPQFLLEQLLSHIYTRFALNNALR